MKNFLLYIFLSLICNVAALGQQPIKYSFAHYGAAAGLMSNEVINTQQDADGYIWLATGGGLQRFDGLRFLTFRNEKDNPLSIPSTYIANMVMDLRKNLWLIGTSDKVGIFDTRRFIFKNIPIKASDPKNASEPKGIIEDEEGNIMLLIAQRELLTYDEKQQEFSSRLNFIDVPKNWKVTGIYQVPGTTKYIIGAKEGIAIYNKKTKQLSYPEHNTANEKLVDAFGSLEGPVGFTLDKQQRLWFTNWQDGGPAIYCFDWKQNKIVHDEMRLGSQVMSYHEIHGFMLQRDGSLWVKGLNIFARYQENEKAFRLVYNGYENEQSIAFTKINYLSEDREGNLWVATSNNGLYRFNPAQQFFSNIRQVNRVTRRPGDGSTMAFINCRDGSILAGTWGDGVYRYDKDFNPLPLNIKGYGETGTPSLWSMYLSKDSNTIWAGAQPGIHRIDQRNRRVTIYNPAILKEKTIRQVVEDKMGNLWIGTQSIGLFKWDAEKGKSKFEEGITQFSGIPGYQVLKLCVDKKGNVWVATNGGGVYVINPESNSIIQRFTSKEPTERKIFGDMAASVFQYDDNTMIIAANALHIYDINQQKITKTIRIPESIPGYISALEKDQYGYVWVSMSSGICRVNIRNNIFIHFDRIDGISNDFFIIAASYRLPDGRLLFGADNQMVYFDPSKVKINDPAPDVAITGFRLRNESLSVDSLLKQNRIELAPDNNSIAIDFSGLAYNGAYLIKYMLEGLDKDWVSADKTNTAVYSYLAPGTYTFMLRSEDAEGNVSKNVTKMVIKVRPPFWRTWWFLGLVIFAATVVLFWLDKLRIQKVRDMESVRTRIATSLTEDMSSSLSSINISSELAKTKVDTDTKRTKEYIGQISETSNRMVQAMYDMVWSIDPKNDTMADTIERMKSFAIEIENSFPINIDFDIDKQVNRLELDMEHRYELLSIYKESVTNAARHSDGRHVKVSLRYNKSRLVMLILDDGKGFLMTDAAMLARGISDMRRRASGINAVFYIESEINTGTIVKLEMTV